MNNTIETDLPERLASRLLAAQSLSGRCLLRLHSLLRRSWWRLRLAAGQTGKRLLDASAGILLILALSPLLLLVALLIKLQDGGPVIFSQWRVGRHGRLFKMHKFRSMFVDAEGRLGSVIAANRHRAGITVKIKDDPRITPVGRWIRRWSLDELPQFFDVVRGDMSLVGPRPPLLREVNLYHPADRRRLAVKPGVTCLWQIGGRSEIDFPGQVQLDVEYIENQSFTMDVKILLRTIPAVLSGKGAC